MSVIPAATQFDQEGTISATVSFNEVLAAAVPDGEAEPDHDDEAKDAVPMPLPFFPWSPTLNPLSTSGEAGQSGADSPEWSSVLPSAASNPAPSQPNSATDRWNPGSSGRAAEQDEASPAQYGGATLRQDASCFVPDRTDAGTANPIASQIAVTGSSGGADQQDEGTPAQYGGPTLRQPNEFRSVRDQVAVGAVDQPPVASSAPAAEQDETLPVHYGSRILRRPDASRSVRDQAAAQTAADLCDVGSSGRPAAQQVETATEHSCNSTPIQPVASVVVPEPTSAAPAPQHATDALTVEDELSVQRHDTHEFGSEPPRHHLTQPWRSELDQPGSNRSQTAGRRSVQAPDGAPAAVSWRSEFTPDREPTDEFLRYRSAEGDEAVRPPTESADRLRVDSGTRYQAAGGELSSNANAGLERAASDTARAFAVGARNAIPDQPENFASQSSWAGWPARRGPDSARHTAAAPARDKMEPLETAVAGSIRPVPVPDGEPDRPVTSGIWAPSVETTGPHESGEPERAPVETAPMYREVTAGAPALRVTPPDSKPDGRTEPTAPPLPPATDAPQPPRVDKISVAVGGGEGQPRAEILLQHKPDGAIQMAIRTADARLAESLRSGLPELNSHLESRGFQSEFHSDPARESAGDSQEQQHRRPRWFYERNDDD